MHPALARKEEVTVVSERLWGTSWTNKHVDVRWQLDVQCNTRETCSIQTRPVATKTKPSKMWGSFSLKSIWSPRWFCCAVDGSQDTVHKTGMWSKGPHAIKTRATHCDPLPLCSILSDGNKGKALFSREGHMVGSTCCSCPGTDPWNNSRR